MTKEEFQQAINEASFQVAKTMPKIPHEYSVRKNWSDGKRFEAVARYIRENGYEQKFFSKTFVYYDFDGYQYWTMGAALDITIILNRAKIKTEV